MNTFSSDEQMALDYFENGISDNRLFDYAHCPSFFVDSNGIVRRMNVAFRELFYEGCVGCCGNHYSRLVERLASYELHKLLPANGVVLKYASSSIPNRGVHCSTSDLSVATNNVEFSSPRFGRIKLRITELPFIDPDSGQYIGSMISLEVLQVSEVNAFRNAINNALSHELLWEVYASSYDRVLPELFFYQEAIDRHCSILADSRIKSVIDVGAGTGLQMQKLLQSGKLVTAVEVGYAMLRRLKSKVCAEFRNRCVIIEDSAERLPYLKSKSFDAATVLLAFFDMRNPWKALREVQRLVVPGGTIVITEPRACFNVEQLMSAGKDSLIADGRFGRLESDWSRIETIAPLIADRITQAQECNLSEFSDMPWSAENAHEVLKSEGYRDLAICDSHIGNCATISGTKPMIGR